MHFTFCSFWLACVCARAHFPETNGNQRKNKVVKHSARKLISPAVAGREKHTFLLAFLRAGFYCLFPVIGQFGPKMDANCAGRCERKIEALNFPGCGLF